MKLTAVEKVVAEMRAEMRVVDECIARLIAESQPSNTLETHSRMLAACIARLSSNGSEPTAPKPTRTRRGRKAAGADL